MEVSKQINALDLEKTIQWKDSTLWQPRALPSLLQLIDRYELRIEPDEALVFVLTGFDTDVVAKYHKRSPLSETALKTLARFLATPPSPQGLEGVIRFLESNVIWSPEIEAHLMSIASDPTDRGYVQVTALRLLVGHGAEIAFIEGIAKTSANQDLRQHAFEILVEKQHRATIERALSGLTDDDLQAGNVNIPDTSPLGWLVKIKSNFAWDKVKDLRARALKLEFPMLVGLITNALAGIDRGKTANLIRQQADLAPTSWRAVQIGQAIEQQRLAAIERAQQTPFDEVLKRLKGNTSMDRLKVLCEGTTDRPVFKSLVGQLGSVPNVLFDSVGGWGGLRGESDPNIWLLGCKEAIMVMDGDEGRHLSRRHKPYTKAAKAERKKASSLPIDLRILERYGIENYFPQHVLEQVIGVDLSAYFPVPDHVSVIEHLSKSRTSYSYRLRKLVARRLGLGMPSPREPLYSKKRNSEVAQCLSLSDLKGTDLFKIIHDIGERANQIADE